MGTSLSYGHPLDFIIAERAITIAAIILKKDELLLKYTCAWEKRTLCKDKSPLKECDALILGSIMKSLSSAKSASEFQGMSVLGLRDKINSFQLNFFPKYRHASSDSSSPGIYRQCYCGHNSRCFVQDGSHSDTCSPMPEFLALIDSIISCVSGMGLEASERILLRGPKWGAVDIR